MGVFMIQFLYIAGLGPIFGAILGAMYGLSYTSGSSRVHIMGATHDYFGYAFCSHGGASLPELVGHTSGKI